MTPEVTLQALLVIWDELPGLIGADWRTILPELEAVLDRLRATQDPDATTDLVLILRPYPDARTRLQEAVEAASAPGPASPPRRRVRGASDAGLVDAPAVAAGHSLAELTDRLTGRAVTARQALDAAASTVTCHVRGEMDQTLVVDRTTTVEVVVSREAIGGTINAAAAEGAAKVDPGRRLIIQILAKANAEIVSEDRAEIDVPPTGQPQHLYFDLRPTDPGEASVWVVVRQGQIPLVTLKLTARVVPATSRARSVARRSAEGQAADAPQLTEPRQQLRINQAERGGTHFYEFELYASAPPLFGRWESEPITANPEQYVSSLFKRIEERWLSTKGDVAEFTEELRDFGAELLDQLVPEELQRILWVNRQRLTSIQVLATEPFIPWELIHLRPPGKPLPKETRFLGQMGLVRWLYEGSWMPDRMRVRPGRARYVIPDYPDPRYALPETRAERGFLEETFGATAVVPQPNPVRTLLATKGAFDLLHFAGHGAADSDAISEAQILLQGRMEDGQYIRASLTPAAISSRADLIGDDKSRPIVVLNACQVGREGYLLTGLGGFAEAFLKCGAGAFIGSQWSVGDIPARVFTETLYRQLLEGKTVAEATVAARERARKDGDATWLAYAVYAHPYARLVR